MRQHAFAGVNQHQCKLCGGGAGGHVAGVLRVARCVGHHKFALCARKKPVSHVNPDAPPALGLQAIDQQGKVKLVALRAVLLGVARQCLQRVVKPTAGFVQQPPDQR